MRAKQYAVAGLFLILLAGTVRSETPEIRSMGKIEGGSGSLQVDRYSAPFVADWNSDGRKDLIVGQYMWGNVLLFVNRGTDLNPSFDRGRLILCGEEPITTSFS